MKMSMFRDEIFYCDGEGKIFLYSFAIDNHRFICLENFSKGINRSRSVNPSFNARRGTICLHNHSILESLTFLW